VGADDRHRAAPRDAGFRRARPRALEPARHPDAAGVRGVVGDPPSAPANSPMCGGRRCSTTVELSAADIARLAKEARPLIRSGGKWVALDKADLHAAAAALAERASTTQLSGADMLRLALGLEGSPLSGGISVEGGGWAADLLAAADDLSGEPASAPKGFRRRSCAATRPRRSRGWASSTPPHRRVPRPRHGSGQETPTMLAHLLAAAEGGPALVIAPPAGG